MTLSRFEAPSQEITKVDCLVIAGDVEVVVASAPRALDAPVQSVPEGPVTEQDALGVRLAALNERSVVAPEFTRSGVAMM